MTSEDKLKEGAQKFMISGALFDKIRVELPNLRPGEFGLDFTEQNLMMCWYIVRAQTQYCAFEKVKRNLTPQQFDMISRLAMQASEYYGKAFSLASTHPLNTVPKIQSFMSILYFNECAFLAQAHYWRAYFYYYQTEQTTQGIGMAVAHINKALEAIEKVMTKGIKIKPELITRYNDFKKTYMERKMFYEDKNNKIYHETIPKTLDNNSIACLNYDTPVNIEADLNRQFEGKEIFARMVPPAVRALLDEYRQYISTIINTALQHINYSNNAYEEFLKKYDLPESLYAASGEQKLPEDLWTKIKQCQDKKGMKFLSHTFDTLITMGESGYQKLENIRLELYIEEQDDENMRAMYGAHWVRNKSRVVTEGIWKQIDYYQGKLDECHKADEHIKKLLNSKEEYLEYLQFERAEIVSKIPKSSHAERQHSFVASKYFLVNLTCKFRLTEQIKELNERKSESEGIHQQMMKTMESDNVTNELFLIVNGSKSKIDVFNELSKKYMEYFAKIQELSKLRIAKLQEMDKLILEFQKEDSGNAEDPVRLDFFKNLNEACDIFNQCYTSLQQGAHFYTQLMDHLDKCAQTVSDYIMSRNIEKNDLLSHLTHIMPILPNNGVDLKSPKFQ